MEQTLQLSAALHESSKTHSCLSLHLGHVYCEVATVLQSKGTPPTEVMAAFMKAKTFYEQAIQINSSLHQPHYALGRLHFILRDFKVAAEKFQQATKLSKKNAGKVPPH